MTTRPAPGPHRGQHLAYVGTEKIRPPSTELGTEPPEHPVKQIDPDRLAAEGPRYDQRGIEVPFIKIPEIQVGDLPVVRVGDGMRVRD